MVRDQVNSEYGRLAKSPNYPTVKTTMNAKPEPRDESSESPSVVNKTSLPLVAIVGRPNVGKSTLFNRLIGQRRSIVGDESGITRDRIYGEGEWAGQRFSLADTAGIVPDDDAVIPTNILKQAGTAIKEARALIWA